MLLPGVEEIPDRLLFLREFHAVSFRHSHVDEDGLFRLEWGITGQKPQSPSESDLPSNPNPPPQQEEKPLEQEPQQQEPIINQQPSQETPSDRETEDRIREEIEGQQLVTAANQPPQTAESVSPSQSEQDDLSSEKGIDYTRLRDLLKAGQWREADQETYEVMIRAVGKKSGDWFEREDLLNFPCADLRTIDGLWVKYSQGKFGFSVQKKIHVECGGKLDGKYSGDKIFFEFILRVGWRGHAVGYYKKYGSLEANPSLSPTGELPALVWLIAMRLRFGRAWRRGMHFFFSRTQTCKL